MSVPADYCVGVLDDSPSARLVTTRLLTRKGYRSLPLESYAQLLQAAPQLDLILLDISLGDLDGRDLARALREEPGRLGSLPLIAVTAYADAPMVESIQDAGFNGYLHKPFRPEHLYAKIDDCLSTLLRTPAPAATLKENPDPPA